MQDCSGTIWRPDKPPYSPYALACKKGSKDCPGCYFSFYNQFWLRERGKMNCLPALRGKTNAATGSQGFLCYEPYKDPFIAAKRVCPDTPETNK